MERKKALVRAIEERVHLVWMVVVFWMRGGGEESLHKAGNNPHIYRATLPDVRAAQTRAPSLKSIHIALPSYPPPHSITQPYFLLVENNLYDQ